MLLLSDILISNYKLTSFNELLPIIESIAQQGERFFKMDVKPTFPDTPANWEDILETTFSCYINR